MSLLFSAREWTSTGTCYASRQKTLKPVYKIKGIIIVHSSSFLQIVAHKEVAQKGKTDISIIFDHQSLCIFGLYTSHFQQGKSSLHAI